MTLLHRVAFRKFITRQNAKRGQRWIIKLIEPNFLGGYFAGPMLLHFFVAKVMKYQLVMVIALHGVVARFNLLNLFIFKSVIILVVVTGNIEISF
jgi:hypothetical protein